MDNITEAIKSHLHISDKIDFNHHAKLYMSRDAFMQFVKELVEEGFDKDEVKEVFKGFYLSTYLKFSENLENKNYWADQSMILLLAEKLKINIVLISSRTLEVYDYTDKYNPDYVSIVLLYIDGAHFDPLCKKVSPYDEKCQYTFSLDELKSII